MLTSKAKLTAKLALAALWVAAGPVSGAAAAPADSAAAARSTALKECSWMSDGIWNYAYRACMAEHGQSE
jgi:hypothetical protein